VKGVHSPLASRWKYSTPPFSESYEEQARLASPDRRVEAVWVQIGGGATTGFAYHLYIVRFGDKPQRGMQLLTADRISNLKMSWREPKRLEISYDSARSFNFFNFWHDREVDDYKYVVEIRLSPNKSSQLE
jgi:hypothetical protein